MLERNIAQEKAIETIHGPVNVISCPGSGKTTTLVRRINNIIKHGVDPKRVLMITFANSAAKDMQERYVKLYKSNPGVTFMTIHSLCFYILKAELGYTSESLISETQKMEFLVNQLKNNIYVTDAWEMAKTIATEMSVVRNSYIPLSKYNPSGCDKELFVSIYNAYEAEKRNGGKIDFDDMLVKCEELLSSNKAIADKWGSYFDYIQVDEYQDTNQIQKDIIYHLIKRTRNLCVVGDDDQSLYSWRGADPTIMMTFNKDFEDAVEINMSTNYRSAQKIVDYADTLIKRNKVRFDKDFISFRGQKGIEGEVVFLEAKGKLEEMTLVSEKIQQLHEEGVDYKDMAILFRTNKQAEVPAEHLSRKNIPFSSTEKIKSIYESYIFKDIKAYIELSLGRENKYQSNLYTVLNHPNRYLNIRSFKGVPFNEESFLAAIEPLRYSRDSWRYTNAEKDIQVLFENFGYGKVTPQTAPKEVMERLENSSKINYLKHLKSVAQMKNEDAQDELELFNLLKEDALNFHSVEAWLKHANFMVLKTQELNRKKVDNGVKLTTMHKSKGLEWKVVFAIGVDDGVLPSKLSIMDGNIEEERRILYVAMTRAVDKLFVSFNSKMSIFLEELLNDYKEKTNPSIKKKLPGAKVQHTTYGEGKVVRYTDNAIEIDFKDMGKRSLLFPESFKKGFCKYL